MGCYISRLENLNTIFDTYFFLVGDYSNRSFVNDIFRNDFRSIAKKIGGHAVIIDQNNDLEHDLMRALTNYPDYDIGLSLSAFSTELPGLLIIDRRSMELLMKCRNDPISFFRPKEYDSTALNIIYIPFELMELAYTSPNILIRDLVDFAWRKNNNLLHRTMHADAHVRTLEQFHSFNSRWGMSRYRAATHTPDDQSPDPYDEHILCHHIETALTNILRNSTYRGLLEDKINDAVRDNLRMIYDVYDQTRQGLSEAGKDAGRPDLIIADPYGLPYALIEALRLPYLDTNTLSRHFTKALVNYDPLGLALDFLFCYVTCVDFDAFCGKLSAYLDAIEFPCERLGAVRELPSRFAEMRHFQITLRRQGMPFDVHIYAIHLPE